MVVNYSGRVFYMPGEDLFYKMSGSGNDFVAFDRLGRGSGFALPDPTAIRALCRRREGVGADGVLVLIDADDPAIDYQLVYFNADGSRAGLCGNASLCGVRLALELGRGAANEVVFLTDAGMARGRLRGGTPEIDLPAPTESSPDSSWLWDAVGGLEDGDRRLGFVRVGVPHLVILCASADDVDLERRGPPLRRHPSLVDGANVNFVSPWPDGSWRMRTFERGVEAETLACGTGSVATALMLTAWGEAADDEYGTTALPAAASTPGTGRRTGVEVRTSSGRLHRVELRHEGGGIILPSLAGEGRIVYRGELVEPT